MSQRIFATKQDGAGQGFSEQQEEPAEKKISIGIFKLILGLSSDNILQIFYCR